MDGRASDMTNTAVQSPCHYAICKAVGVSSGGQQGNLSKVYVAILQPCWSCPSGHTRSAEDSTNQQHGTLPRWPSGPSIVHMMAFDLCYGTRGESPNGWKRLYLACTRPAHVRWVQKSQTAMRAACKSCGVTGSHMAACSNQRGFASMQSGNDACVRRPL